MQIFSEFSENMKKKIKIWGQSLLSCCSTFWWKFGFWGAESRKKSILGESWSLIFFSSDFLGMFRNNLIK